MKKLIAVATLTLMCGSAFAQNTGPAPQTGMEKPGMTKGATEKGAMDTSGTTGMNKNSMSTDGMKDMSKDGSPAGGKKDDMKK
jgi:hypothetical protein